jgi:hypothetical protein
VTDEQRDIERRAGQIIWRAASLTPGVPGHASKTAMLVAEMCALIREVQHGHAVVLMQEELASPTGRTPEPVALQQLTPPRTDPEDLKLLLTKYAKPERRHP